MAVTTFSVFERTIYLGSATRIIDRQVAICATEDQALDEIRRLSKEARPDVRCELYGAPDSECPTYYYKAGALAIGLALVP